MTPILVNGRFVALGEAVHFPPWERFSDFPFRSYSSFCKKKTDWPVKSRPPPLPTVRPPSASNSPSALSAGWKAQLMSSHQPLIGQFWKKAHKRGNTPVTKNICSHWKSQRQVCRGRHHRQLPADRRTLGSHTGEIAVGQKKLNIRQPNKYEGGNNDMKAAPFQFQLDNKT